MKFKNVSLYMLPLVMLGCSATVDPHINMKPPAYVEELAPKQNHNTQTNPGSLFGKGDNPLFSDKKAMNVNDLVTVIIRETATQNSQGSKATSKNNNVNLGGGQITTGAGLSKARDFLNDYTNVGYKTSSTSQYQGTGTQTRSENFQTTISARVIKVLSNGNYFIEGSRELLINGEKQIIQLSGVIRPYDISQDNMIDSKYIADAKILYKTEGDIDKSTRKPWGTKFMETVWPF